MPVAKIASHTAGIDFTKPVEIVVLPKDTIAHQYQVPGGPQGSYYTRPGTPPGSLGIAEKAKDWNTGEIFGKEVNEYITHKNVTVLKSSASKIEDTWSIPGEKIKTEGGAIQYFTMDKDGFFKN